MPNALAQAQAGPAPIVIDHDPMGTTIGRPPPVVGTVPGLHPPPRVAPEPSLNQIVVECATPVFVSTGNVTPTSERLRLQCYVSQGQSGETIRLRRLREGTDGDYSLARRSVGIANGRATFVVRFHRRVLQVGQRVLSARTVYLVISKATVRRGGDLSGNIQTVTVLSDDPAAFGLGSGDKKHKK